MQKFKQQSMIALTQLSTQAPDPALTSTLWNLSRSTVQGGFVLASPKDVLERVRGERKEKDGVRGRNTDVREKH